MGSVLRKTEIEFDAPKPPQKHKVSAFSSYVPRRSHLESASYRSLVRILSQCLDRSLVPSPPPPKKNICAGNPTSSKERCDLALEEEAGANIKEGTLMERQSEGDCCADGGGYERSLVVDAELLGLDIDNFDGEFEAHVDSELLNEVMSDCGKLIGASNEELCFGGESHEGKGKAGLQEVVNKDLQIKKAGVHGAVISISNLKEVSEDVKGYNSNELGNNLIDAPYRELCLSALSHDGNGQTGHDQIVDNVMELSKDCVRGVEEGIFNLVEVDKEDVNGKLLNTVMPDCGMSTHEHNLKLRSSGESQGGNEQASNEMIVENGLEITKAHVSDAEAGFFKLGEVSDVAKEDANSKLITKVTPDCGRLIDAHNEESPWTSESYDGNGQSSHKDIIDSYLEIAKTCIHGAQERSPRPEKVSEAANRDVLEKFPPNISEEKACSSMRELEDRRKRTEDTGNLLSSEPVKDTNDKMSILVEISRVEEKTEVREQPTCVHSSSLMNLSKLEEVQVSTLALQIDKGEFEEGEIPCETHDLECPVHINGNEGNQRASIHKEKANDLGTGNEPSTFERRVSNIYFEADLSYTSDNDSTDEATQGKQMVIEGRERKRNPLTEQRKAKKKIAKKRKRAQKNREQGVKKLKLPMMMKPKEVKICNFYLMGKCQQGDRCKYSHDAPLMKSAPCKYFACNSCLKGDDCPYDHDLSKYPCHKFVSTGSCIRGDGCKFSHKMPTADDASLLTSDKPDSHLTSEKPKLKNQTVRSHISPLNKGSFEGNNKGKCTSLERHKPLKEANQVPKGVRFLSFGVAQTNLSSTFKEGMSVKKSGQNGADNQQRHGDLFMHGHQHIALSGASSGSIGDASSYGFALKDSGNFSKGSSIAPPGTTNHEVSEATKILEEFLFCSAS